jgi:hypothetical protein
MESGDVIVYAHPDGVNYLAAWDDGKYWQWPAKDGGWKDRKAGKEADVDTSRELDPQHARLALRLSGVTP